MTSPAAFDLNPQGPGDLQALTTAGTAIVPAFISGFGQGAVTLLANTTYFFSAGESEAIGLNAASVASFHARWDANIVVNLYLELCNFPAHVQGRRDGPMDVPSYDLTDGNWIQENPSTAYVSTTATDGTTGGATATGSMLTIAGGTAGGATWNIGNIGTRRARIKAVVGATGGNLRMNGRLKLG